MLGTSRLRRCFLANIPQLKNQTIDLLPHLHPHQQLMPSPAALPVYDTSKWLEDFFMLLYRSVAKYCTFARYALRLGKSTQAHFAQRQQSSWWQQAGPSRSCRKCRNFYPQYRSSEVRQRTVGHRQFLTLCACTSGLARGGQAMSTMDCTGLAVNT